MTILSVFSVDSLPSVLYLELLVIVTACVSLDADRYIHFLLYPAAVTVFHLFSI